MGLKCVCVCVGGGWAVGLGLAGSCNASAQHKTAVTIHIQATAVTFVYSLRIATNYYCNNGYFMLNAIHHLHYNKIHVSIC